MADPVNLNRFRKNKARRAAKDIADKNAVLHGLPKAQKTQARAEASRRDKQLDAGRLDHPDSD